MKYIKTYEAKKINWNDVLRKASFPGGNKDRAGNTMYDENYINFDKVILAVENGADVDSCGTLGWAVRTNNLPVIKYMFEHGADINKQDDSCKWTPIMSAVGTNNGKSGTPINLEMCLYLLDHGADPTIGNFQDITTLDLLHHTKMRNFNPAYPSVPESEQIKMDAISKHIIDLLLEKHPEEAPKYIEYLTPEQKIILAPYLDADKYNL